MLPVYRISQYIIILLVSSFIIAGCVPIKQKTAAPKLPPVVREPAKTSTATVKVALLLPLTGTSKELGHNMLDAAQLALYNSGQKNMQLLPFDTEASPEAAVQAVRLAITQGAKIIIGPVFSKTTAAIAPITRSANLSMLSFSNNAALKGKGVYLIGFVPDQQIKRVTSYAMKQGITDFYVLAPANSYGKMAVDALNETVANSEATVVKTEFYPEQNQEGFTLSLKSISDALLSVSGNAAKAGHSALLIPEGGEKLSKIAAQLALSGLDFSQIKLIGSGQWDDDSTKKIPLLQGGWFAGASPEKHALFEQQFTEQFGYRPVRIASLSYDAVALLAALLAQQQDLTSEALLYSKGFSGVDGLFRLRADGTSERGLSVLQITVTGFQAVDPAPSTF